MRARLVLLVLVAAWTTGARWEHTAKADTPDAQREQAKEHFSLGTDAFKRGDFVLAGTEFDAAYAAAPHYDALWNAAEAWERGRDLPKAANRYADYLDIAPASAPDRNRATDALQALEPRLGRLEVHAQEGAVVAVDGVTRQRRSVYVYPGSHEVTAKLADAVQSRLVSVAAGAVLSVALSEEVAAQPAAPTVPSVAPAPTVAAPEGSGARRLSPWLVVGGGIATAVCGGFTIGSGVQTLSDRSAFVAHMTGPGYDAGVAAQTRTNVLLGITGGLALTTAVVAAFFVDFGHGGKSAELRASPTGGSFRLTF